MTDFLLALYRGDFLDSTDIKSFTIEELEEKIVQLGLPKFRAKQIFSWLHKGVESFDEMTNLSKDLREVLSKSFVIRSVSIKKRLESCVDDTVKYLYELCDGEYIESVLMKYKHGYSICISTQVGCRMNCSFCASGLNGLSRNLTPSEMLSQIMVAQKDNNIRISNVVLMGMGEPLDNYDNTIRFLKLVSDENGLNIGLRHISLSTSGHVAGIEKLMKEKLPITLSISLHAPTDEIRSSMMPVNKKWNIESLISACKEYIKVTNRRISFEYALISGVNDSDLCARQLFKLLKGMLCHINLIPANPVKENDFQKPDNAKVQHFCDLLNNYGITTTVRRTLGADIDASCGQLRRKEIEN